MVSLSVDSIIHLATPPAAASAAKHGPLKGPSFSDHLEKAEPAPPHAPEAKQAEKRDDTVHSEPASASQTDAESEQNEADGAEQANDHADVRGDGAEQADDHAEVRGDRPSAEEDSAHEDESRDQVEVSAEAVASTDKPPEDAAEQAVRSEETEDSHEESVRAAATGKSKSVSPNNPAAADDDPQRNGRSEQNVPRAAPDETTTFEAIAAADDSRSVSGAPPPKDGPEPDSATDRKTHRKAEPTPQADVTRSDGPLQPREPAADSPRPANAPRREARPHAPDDDAKPIAQLPPRDGGSRHEASGSTAESPRLETAEPVRGTGSTPTESPAASEPRLRISAGRLAGNPDSSPGTPTRSADQVRFVQRVARALHTARNGPGEVRLRLHPPELGHLRLEVRVEDGVLQARMETETATAKTVLLDNLPALRERLAQQEIRLDRVNVEVMTQSDGGPGQRAAEDARPDRQQTSLHRAPQEEEAGDGDAEATDLVDYDNGNLNVVI